MGRQGGRGDRQVHREARRQGGRGDRQVHVEARRQGKRQETRYGGKEAGKLRGREVRKLEGRQGGKESGKEGGKQGGSEAKRDGGGEKGKRRNGVHFTVGSQCFHKLTYLTTETLTLLLVIQTGDHAVPNECDSNLTTPAESTLTGVPSSENLHGKTENQEINTIFWLKFITFSRLFRNSQG